jgi:hypothetical protein
VEDRARQINATLDQLTSKDPALDESINSPYAVSL